MNYTFSNGNFYQNGRPLKYLSDNKEDWNSLHVGDSILLRSVQRFKAEYAVIIRGKIQSINQGRVEVKVTKKVFSTSYWNTFPCKVRQHVRTPITSVVKEEE